MSELQPWRTFSIFISSTFADMQAERDHLKNIVFPQVEEELQKRRIKLEIVDLRWGVDTTSIAQEDEREASVLKVCLDEIRRCRPFFIGLLGDRYGWVPPEERMKQAVAGEDHIRPEKGKSVTALEIEFGVLASKEQLVRSVFYFREPLPYGKLSKEKASFFSDENNPELSAAEKMERKTALQNLKVNIRHHFEKKKLENKVKTYAVDWNETTGRITGLEAWGKLVYKDILDECESHAKATWDQLPKNWQEQELALLDAFVETQTQTFRGRRPLLDELKQHLLSDHPENWGLVLTGESGSGKSAVFAMVYKMMQHEDCFILAHSAGLSPRAKHVADLLQIWNKQLANELGIKEEESETAGQAEETEKGLPGEPGKVPETPIEKLQDKFNELLNLASAKKKVVVLVDALDRFEPTARARHLSWLPGLMPQNMRLLCTAITGTEQKAVQYHKGLTEKSIDSFTKAEAKEMLDALCLRQHKSLSPKIEKIILEKLRADGLLATASPLWLSLAVNMLMAIDRDDFERMSRLEGRADRQIETYLADMADKFDPLPGPLFLNLLEKAGEVFGKTITAEVFSYIAISRNGLREKDLEKLLPANAWDPLQFAGLRRWFKAHLVLQGEEQQWNLVHSILDNTLLDKLKDTGRKAKHHAVGSYLLNLPDNDALKISETMYHLMQADNRELAAGYYGSYWWNKIQTDGSSKTLSESLILDEVGQKPDSLNWIISLAVEVSRNNDMLRTLLNNLVFSLYDKHLQSDITVNTRIKLMVTIERQMVELRQRAPDSADYARDLSVSYDKLGDLYLQLGDPPKALDKYQASLEIAEELRQRAPDSADYARDLSVSYNKLGDLYLKLGDPPKALDKYQASLEIAEELRQRAPDSADYARDLSVSYNKLGDLYLQLGDPPKALDKYQASLEIAEELRQRAPDSADYARDLSVSYEKLGDLYLQLGDPPKALDKYQASLEIREELRQRAPDSADYARDLSVSYNKLGDLYLKLGDPPKALDKYQASLEIAEELRQRAPDSADYARDLSVSYNKLGDLYLQLGDPPKALDKYQASLEIREELRQRAPDSADYARDLSVSYEKLGDLYLKLGDPPKALDKYQASLEIREELRQRAPDSADYARDLSVSYNKLGDLYLQLGDPPKALDKYQASLEIAEELRQRAPDSADYARDLSVSYNKLGDLYLKLGDPPKALDKYQASLEIREELRQRAPDSADYARDLSVSYEKLGDLYLKLGDPPKALDKYQASLEIREELRQRAPDSADYARDLSVSYNKLGDLYLQLGDPPKALDKYQASLEIAEELRQRAPDSADYARDVWVSYWRMAQINESNENYKAANAWWKKAYMSLGKIKKRGMFVSQEDEEYFEYLKKKVATELFSKESEKYKKKILEKITLDSNNRKQSIDKNQKIKDQVDCTVYSHSETKTGESLLIQVYAHLYEKSNEAESMAKEFDKDSARRGFTSLSIDVERSSLLMFELSFEKIKIKDPVQTLIWKGKTESVEFEVQIPEIFPAGNLIGKIIISQNSIPIGHIRFKINVLEKQQLCNEEQNPIPNGKAKQYKYAFISYASQDKEEVLRRVQMLSSLKIRYFQDIMNLEPGDRWAQKIYKHIDVADVFFLFWSRAASKSEWVLKETQYALKRKGGEDHLPPEILPIILEKAPIPDPPEELKDIHFNDKVIYFMDQTK